MRVWMSKNDFDEFQKQIQKMFGNNVKLQTPFGNNFQNTAGGVFRTHSMRYKPDEHGTALGWLSFTIFTWRPAVRYKHGNNRLRIILSETEGPFSTRELKIVIQITMREGNTVLEKCGDRETTTFLSSEVPSSVYPHRAHTNRRYLWPNHILFFLPQQRWFVSK